MAARSSTTASIRSTREFATTGSSDGMLQQLHRAPASQFLAPTIAMQVADSDASSTKCRYKTGKCTNARSSKRNGQPHQLCLYHRDKANQIQRKFDRQKRQVLRERKTSTTARPTSAAAALHLSHLNVHHFFPATPRFRSSSAKELDLYSDSDSSRVSTDSSSSDSSVASVLEQVWQDMPLSPTALMSLRLTPTAMASPVSPPSSSHHGLSPTQGHLSHDEIDFLCSAMLE